MKKNLVIGTILITTFFMSSCLFAQEKEEVIGKTKRDSCKKGEGIVPSLSLAELLSGLVDFGKEAKIEGKGLKCANCGMNQMEFRRRGQLGCSYCYQAFKPILLPLLKKLHGSTQHTGKLPLTAGKEIVQQRGIQRLKERLQKAIQLEEFEEAAKLRDRIKELGKR